MIGVSVPRLHPGIGVNPGARLMSGARPDFGRHHLEADSHTQDAGTDCARTPDAESPGRTATWTSWGTTASVSVTDPAALPAARRLVARRFAEVEKAAARFRPDAELHRLYRAGGRVVTVSSVLAELVSAALAAAERTGGDVDPTVAAAMTAVHGPHRQGRDSSPLPVCGTRTGGGRAVPGWQQVQLQGRRLRVPAGVTLDLGATATAVACDQAAAQVRDRLGVGVLVTLGGDAASAGPAPDRGWRVLIGDRTGECPAEVLLPAGSALATSHFTARARGGHTGPGGHLIDPRTGRAPVPVWRMASAIGFTSLEASTLTAASLVRGTAARSWLVQLGVPARLVTVHDDVITVGPWPATITGPTHFTTRDAVAVAGPEPLPLPRVATDPRRTFR